MIAPFIAAFSSLIPIIRTWSENNDASLLERVVETAKHITGENDPLVSYNVFRENPEMLCQFQQRIMELELERQKITIDDRNNARQRDMAFIHTGKPNRRADIMVISAALGLLACLLAMTYFANQMPGEAVGIISTVAGIFGSCLKDAYAFEFGSSRGSKEKDSTVAALLDRSRGS